MSTTLFLLVLIFVIINIVQTWLILTYRLLTKGGIIIGLIEAIEFPVLILLILKGGMAGFLTIVIVEFVQWTTIALLSLRGKPR
ncbi:hypothetical protein CO121_01585 [bacterium (Candidatus Gribaldobacteria) CG_4_9_14_3_um_filter_36_15]|uniref:Uncharacterized protein n=2 Tax=Candidatus Gribaldobacteria TaxID=2798536 RepID=A0A2M7VKU4_9BACT|nr:MAG: hypothetical protein AUK07_00820 [Parcubacteria group bacterium CG2_30_36_21]PJA02470.1 MAG: hypothetical protein COX73_00620 [bacterium (Candidatus Gribaldobacteria) CG_4_10_14_0_2_um_filter_36_18]PJB09130.1 MAG: hypothetical protein CO121_01585 [bacterium (Candidatus Gribaldobacteria) CG_4_9_14_3_um_filter_36_15]